MIIFRTGLQIYSTTCYSYAYYRIKSFR